VIDQWQWDALVERYCQQVWDTARSFGLDSGAAAEVCQLAWLRLADHLAEAGTDDEMGSWLCVIATDESRKVAQGRHVWALVSATAAALAVAAVAVVLVILS
jgi:DNA-directed RNA polymerase specialized sigma24 family protein